MFMLLLFFMISTTFVQYPSIKLELPTASTAESSKPEPLTLTIDKQGRLFLNQMSIKENELQTALRKAAGKPDSTLVLRADKDVPYGHVIRAMDITRQSGIRRIVSMTEATAK